MAGSAEILTALRELANSKQIERGELHELLKDGIHAALAKKHGPTVQAEVEIDDAKGDIRIVILKKVVEEVDRRHRIEISLEEARYEDPDFQVGRHHGDSRSSSPSSGAPRCRPRSSGSCSASARASATKIRDEFSSRVGDLLSGEMQQIERGKIVLMLNKFREAEAIIPYREQNHRETYTQGEPVRAVLKKIEETPKGPRLILSRADALFVQALFKLEVPEIQSGHRRDPRRVARSREPHQDRRRLAGRRDRSRRRVRGPEGLARAGRRERARRRAHRHRAVVGRPRALRQARPRPGEGRRVFSEPTTKTIQAVVDEDQLSLAIGRNGQNVRLASELTGWKIDLYSSREWLEKGGDIPLFAPLPDDEAADVPLSDIEGLATATVAVLEAGGYRTLNDIIDLEREDLLKLPGIAPEEADRIMAIINELTEEGAGEGAGTD
jgi:N utilization substance protein A